MFTDVGGSTLNRQHHKNHVAGCENNTALAVFDNAACFIRYVGEGKYALVEGKNGEQIRLFASQYVSLKRHIAAALNSKYMLQTLVNAYAD